MKLVAKIESEIELMHISGKQVVLSENITKEFDEFSEEYAKICKEYESLIGYKRDENKTKFDEELLTTMLEDLKTEKLATLDRIMNVVKQVYASPDKKSGYVQIQSAVINVKDFSCVRIKKFNTNISKR